MFHDVQPMTQEELALLNELLVSKFGLYFPDHKREILQNRLAPRLRSNHVHSFLDYYLLLQYDFEREVDPLVRAITNNESYFFREVTQFDALTGPVLDGLRRGGTAGKLRLLSAGCSSGEEPYTLGIYLRRQTFPGSYTIDGVDIDSERLEMARRAIYRPTALRTLDREAIDRHFQPRDAESWELRTTYREGVSFRCGNLVDLPSLRAGDGTYDAIFCRNVLIYFSESALKQAIANFARLVRVGGLLFLGHSESIIGLTKKFTAERLGQCIAYRRTEE